MQALLCSRRIPGPTSFWEVAVIAPEWPFFRKVFNRQSDLSLQGDNKRGTVQWMPRNTISRFVSNYEINSFDLKTPLLRCMIHPF